LLLEAPKQTPKQRWWQRLFRPWRWVDKAAPIWFRRYISYFTTPFANIFANEIFTTINNKWIVALLPRAFWPGLFIKGNAAQVSDEYIW
jgi:hypothetical protein